MMKKSGHEVTLADLQKQLSDAQDRAHKSGERAAQQFAKLLGTVQGGLGVAIAAWLQRIFEHGHGPLSPLAWYLAIALFCVVFGLAVLVFTQLLDQRSAGHSARSTVLNSTRAWHHEELRLIESMPRSDERSTKELSFASEDEKLSTEIDAADAGVTSINAWSQRMEVCSWVALCVAFLTVGIGIVKTLNSLQ